MMKERYQLVAIFSDIAAQMKHSNPSGDRAIIIAKLEAAKLLEERPENPLLQLHYDEMRDSFVRAVEVMQYDDSPTSVLVLFEKAVAVQAAYEKACASDSRPEPAFTSGN